MVYEGLIMVLAASIGALGSLGSGFVSAGASNVSSRKAFQRQQALQEQAARLNYDYSIKYNRNTLQNNPLYTRQGLEKGGYNPMLAVQNGTSGTGASSFTSAGQAPQHDMSQAVSNAMDFSRLQNETKQSDAQTDAYYAMADKTKMEKAKLIQELPYVGDKAKADYIKTQMESAKLENDIHYQNEYLKYLQNSLGLQRELGVMGFSNSKDVANIMAGASKYGSNVGASTDLIKSILSTGLGIYTLRNAKTFLPLIKKADDIVKVIPRSYRY